MYTTKILCNTKALNFAPRNTKIPYKPRVLNFAPKFTKISYKSKVSFEKSRAYNFVSQLIKISNVSKFERFNVTPKICAINCLPIVHQKRFVCQNNKRSIQEVVNDYEKKSTKLNRRIWFEKTISKSLDNAGRFILIPICVPLITILILPIVMVFIFDFLNDTSGYPSDEKKISWKEEEKRLGEEFIDDVKSHDMGEIVEYMMQNDDIPYILDILSPNDKEFMNYIKKNKDIETHIERNHYQIYSLFEKRLKCDKYT